MTADRIVPDGYVDALFDLSGRVGVVTGGGSGLGAAIAVGLAQVGVTVVVLDINQVGAQRTVSEIVDRGGRASSAGVDVTERAAVEEAARLVPELFGQVDILVNSAGMAYRSPAETFPEEKLDAILALNLKGTYLCCQAFGRVMLEQGKGSIINMASIGSFVAYPWASAYIASKGGVLSLTRVLALEWRERGVRVNAIAPSLIESALTAAASNQTSLTSDFIKNRMIRPQLGLPHELIGAAIFLASDAAELVTGHTLACDDGYLTA